MKIELACGEELTVSVPETGDLFEISYKEDELTILSELKDDEDRGGEVYYSSFSEEEDESESEGEGEDSKEVVKTITCTGCKKPFDLTKGEVAFMQRVFKDKYVEPQRCKECRRKVRKQIGKRTRQRKERSDANQKAQ